MSPRWWAAALALVASAAAQRSLHEPGPRPAAVVDLRTQAGAGLVLAEWRYADAAIVAVAHREPGPDLKPSGAANRTHDLEPKAGAAGFDDSAWEVVAPEDLERRRAHGRLSFGWYRLAVTLPERLGQVPVTGGTVVFELVLDDYAEVWVDGRLPQVLGQRGGALVAGWNAPNRVVLTRDAQPGQRFQLAILGANAPLSHPPANYVWIRSATLELHAPRAQVPTPAGAPTRVEKLADGFTFLAGPVWHPDGYLLFSEPAANRIWRWSPGGELAVYRSKAGYAGVDIGEHPQPGANGLALDAENRLAICEHGNRRVTRLERNGTLTVLADRYQGRRLNSPSDCVHRSDGALFFTDPPFGLPGRHADPRRELPHCGVYCLHDGVLRLLVADLAGPDGLAFSPDERFLYVADQAPARSVVMRYEVLADGSLAPGVVFFDFGAAPGPHAGGGLKVDRAGNVYVAAPGGVWILSPQGRHEGTIRAPEPPANFAFGDADGRTLYLTARTGLYRLRVDVPGNRLRPYAASRPVTIERADPRLDPLLAAGAAAEVVADGFTWLEGPAWDHAAQRLWFTDIPHNAVWSWSESQGALRVLHPSGYSGARPFAGREPGANGLAFDAAGRLILCEHGDRRVTRLEPDGTRVVLADRFEGRRLNSPNDVAVAHNGDLYFTDPPFGLPLTFSDPARELPFCGVYRLAAADGRLTLLTQELEAPNGIALSPDQRTLYVANAARQRPVWLAYPLRDDGTLGPGRVFADATRWLERGPGNPDGIEVDRDGNLFTAGPGGVYVFAADGTHLGTIRTAATASNVELAGDWLYVTAGDAVLRVRVGGGRGSTAAR